MKLELMEDLDPYTWFCPNCLKKRSASYLDNSSKSVCIGCDRLYRVEGIIKVNTWREKRINYAPVMHGIH